MSRPVDVLAVMDAAIESASLMVKASGDMRAVAYQDDLFKARAAVAELIEVLDVAAYGEYLPETVEQSIRAALVRARGAA